jgi:hypothetical protein
MKTIEEINKVIDKISDKEINDEISLFEEGIKEALY